MIAAEMDIGQGDVENLVAQMRRAQKELGMTEESAVKWAAKSIASSLSAATKVSPKLRKIVKNPDARWKVDRRRAPFGVMKYKDGKESFKPIFRSGEYGSVRFFDSKGASFFRHSGPKGNDWVTVASGSDVANPEIIVPGIKTDNRRKIGRRGLAKKVWQTAAKKVRRGGGISELGVSGIGSVRIMKTAGSFAVVLMNDLRYAIKSFDGGRQTLGSTITRAANSMHKRLDNKIKKDFKKSFGA